ncbi:MAG TPA: hypothetical protein VMR62_08305 [Bryobacteraceae bacterium]|nr:hypothetical protein [Bryobacteraceae bacterium]
MILLDENSLRSQREFLEARRLPVRKVGLDWGRPGMTDGEILTELRGARQVTFFTRDADFYRRSLCHPAYCLVVIAASAEQLASYATRLLRHRSFRTHALRMAKVLRLQPSRILCWVRNSNVVSFR